MQSFKKTVLKNGLRLITIPKKDNLSVTVLVLVEAGSKYETKEINGLSHFLEHMCFKGTKDRPKTIDISGALDGLGAEYNAFTSQEFTGYYAKAQAKHLDTVLDIVSDLYLNPVFDAKEIDKERGVVIQELNMYEDMPNRRVHELFTTLLYGDQPAGWDVGGRKEVIQKLTRDDFIAYRDKHYVASATTVVVAGAFDEEDIIKKVEQIFSGMPTNKKGEKEPTIEQQSKPAVFVKYKDSDQTHLVLGVRAYNVFDEKRYALEVLGDILGGGMGSRLFQVIRDELGAAYYVRAAAELATDHGILSAWIGSDHEKLPSVIDAVIVEFKKLAHEPVGKEELQRAKDHLTGNLILGIETTDALANFYGDQEIITKSIVTPEEIIKRIQAVTAEEIQSVAKEIFTDERLNLAVIGPIKDGAELESRIRFS